jgi:hypothetical protein
MVSQGLDLVCFGVIVEYNTTQQEQELAMHRKLIHSVRALSIALSLLTAGLIMAVPAPDKLANRIETAPAGTEVQADAGAAKAYSGHRRGRNSMALPFFSFAQGLRRGNRS